MIELFIDGLAEPTNPGIGTYGFVIFKDGVKVNDRCGVAGESVTNNFAEYEALVQGLTAIRAYSDDQVNVMSDSQMLVKQMNGDWKVKKGAYREKYFEARRLAEGFKKISFVWIPREMNERADALTRIAYQRHLRGR